MSKRLICDYCGKNIPYKVGELFSLEVSKITGSIDRYPIDPDRVYVLEKDMCLSCFKRLKRVDLGKVN